MKTAILALVSFAAGVGSWAGWTAYQDHGRRIIRLPGGDTLGPSDPHYYDTLAAASGGKPYADLGFQPFDPDTFMASQRLKLPPGATLVTSGETTAQIDKQVKADGPVPQWAIKLAYALTALALLYSVIRFIKWAWEH